jgi:hypothetical protein
MTSWLKYGLKFTHLNLDGLHLGVAVQRHHAVFAANAGVLVAANRHLRRGFTPGVDPADPGFQLMNQAVGAV